MDELINNLRELQQGLADSEVRFEVTANQIVISIGHQETKLNVIRLTRPSSQQIKESASPQSLLVLNHPSVKAAEVARSYNHIVLPEGGFRIVAPGIALMREIPPKKEEEQKQVRLRGRTGLVAETLLLGKVHKWSIQDLAQESTVSTALVHRVLARLENEGWLESEGSGPNKLRTLVNPIALAEAWSQEEAKPKVTLRGYLYGSTPEAVAHKAIGLCPEGAIGGVLAANLYTPTLTRVPYPIRLWVPEGYWLGRLRETGIEETNEGANIEVVQVKSDTWRLHRTTADSNDKDLLKISPWRAWIEISHASGRTRELADTLLRSL